ncbi:MAG: Gfo/Idh/MocA family oxidoreductase, partial [bacterium]|nr:Gfo/Idh/MocA family oxidoreductase [bacterium]
MPKVRLGLLGAGAMGQRVAHAATSSGRFDIVSIADSNQSLASALASEYGATAYDDVGTLCAAGDLDGVYVGLPHHLHASACVAAADADLHVLIDKPLCNTLAEADLIRDSASASTRTWMVGFSYRYRAEWRRAEE